MPDNLEARLIRALETPPPILIPTGFAARVAHSASAIPTPAESWVSPRFGVWAVRGALALLILAMLLFAPSAITRSVVPLTLEFILTAEFVALTVWISLRPHSIR